METVINTAVAARAARNKTPYVRISPPSRRARGWTPHRVRLQERHEPLQCGRRQVVPQQHGTGDGRQPLRDISWGDPLYYRLRQPRQPLEEFKPGREGFYSRISQIATEGWVKMYFTISRWVKTHTERNRRESDGGNISKRLVNASNRLDMLTGDNSMAIESLAKNQYIRMMPLQTVCSVAFSGNKVLDFKTFRERGMDAWFCKSNHNVLTFIHSLFCSPKPQNPIII
jgi:hypothetical protein